MKIIKNTISSGVTNRSERITGNMLASFKIKNEFTPSQMAELFGVGLNSIIKELNRGDEGVESREICFMYRIFAKHPELIERDIEIYDFYKSIGGEDKIGGPMFSLVLGKEQSAYARYFENNKASSSKSAKRMIRYALRASGSIPAVAFDFMVEIAMEESWSRGFSILQERTWNPLHNKFGRSRSQVRMKKEKRVLLQPKKKKIVVKSSKATGKTVGDDNQEEKTIDGAVER